MKTILSLALFITLSYSFAQNNYAQLQKELDGGYYTPTGSSILYFKVYGEYNQSTLTFNVYDDTHAVVASNTVNSSVINSTAKTAGNNEYSINLSTFSTGYYVLEVINEKKEKLYLRFKK